MINIIGLGPGNTGYITKLGEQLIYSSDVVNPLKILREKKWFYLQT